MTDGQAADQVVLNLIRVVTGDAPLGMAANYLHPRVRLHMDAVRYHGIRPWFAWVHLIRNCGRVWDPRLTPVDLRHDPARPDLVHLAMRWSGTDPATHTPTQSAD